MLSMITKCKNDDDIKFCEESHARKPVGLGFYPFPLQQDTKNAYAILIQDIQQIGVWKHSIFFIIVFHSLRRLSVISGN